MPAPSAALPAALDLASPSARSPLAAYREVLLHNAPQISSIESALRSLSYFLPGRFADADLASEGLFAVVNLVSLYHDRILYEAARASGTEFKESLLNQYHRHWRAKSRTVRAASTALTLVQTLESVVEMAALRRWSDKRRWDVVVTLEAIKAVLRLVLVRESRQVTLTPAMPERDVDPAVIDPSRRPQPASDAVDPLNAPYHGPRTGLTLPPAAAMGAGTNQLWEQYLNAKAVKTAFRSPSDLLSRLTGERTVGEVMFILRPLVYAWLLRRHGRKAWGPVVTSALVELLAYLLVTRGTQRTTKLEQEEFKRRAYLFLLYLLRGPVYDKFTKNVLDSFCTSMANKPILRLFSDIVRNYQPLWENVYSYTNGS